MSVAPVDPEQIYKLEKLFIQNMETFKQHCEKYSKWIEMCIGTLVNVNVLKNGNPFGTLEKHACHGEFLEQI